jgi:hypothetical protein
MAGDIQQRFSGETGRAVAGRDDRDRPHQPVRLSIELKQYGT